MRWFDPSHPCQHGSLAQLVEHLTFNQGVPRSSRGWITTFFWPVGQVVKTPPSQGGIGGFKSPTGHHIHFNLGEQFYTRPVGQVVKTPPFHGGIGGSNPPRVTILYGRLAQLGERLPYKQDVGSSILSSSTTVRSKLTLASFLLQLWYTVRYSFDYIYIKESRI